jgi:hypothetical protein
MFPSADLLAPSSLPTTKETVVRTITAVLAAAGKDRAAQVERAVKAL